MPITKIFSKINWHNDNPFDHLPLNASLEFADQKSMVGGFFQAPGFGVDPDFSQALRHGLGAHEEINSPTQISLKAAGLSHIPEGVVAPFLDLLTKKIFPF